MQTENRRTPLHAVHAPLRIFRPTHVNRSDEPMEEGYARALLARAIEMNRPNGMTLLSDVENRAANARYTSMGFVRAEGENSVTATLQL